MRTFLPAVVLVNLFSTAVFAQRLPIENVPPPLAPWVQWVVGDAPEFRCTFGSSEEPVCVWPGQLALTVARNGANFVLSVVSDREDVVALPGGDVAHALDVRVDGRPATLLEGGRVRVGAGNHQVAGRFAWTEAPETLPVPSEVGLVALTVNGQPVPARRVENGSLWLSREGLEDEERETVADQLQITVSRFVRDGFPMIVETRLDLQVAGRSRQVELGAILIPGTTPTEIHAPLPVRFSRAGVLSVQLIPGTHQIVLSAVLTPSGPEQVLSAPRLAAPWPVTETWVFGALESERQIALEGQGIDPARTSLPAEWRSYPAFLLGGERHLTLRTTRRGEAEPLPNQVHIAREMWLDYDGHGFTVRDTMSGRMAQGWRLDLREGRLGRVAIGGHDQLITSPAPDSELRGVELRDANLSMESEWRLPDALWDVPAVAWAHNAQSLRMSLHTPPGYTLFLAQGVDEAHGTWVGKWSVYDFFLVLIFAAFFYRLFGKKEGIAAGVAMVLLRHELGEFRVVFWLIALTALALAYVFRNAGWRNALRKSAFVAWLLLALALFGFVAEECKRVLYPELFARVFVGDGISSNLMGGADYYRREGGRGGEANLGESEMAADVPAPAAPPALESLGYITDGIATRERAGEGLNENARRLRQQMAYGAGSSNAWMDQTAVVQTGPGLPKWAENGQRSQVYTLAWSGPVRKEHRVQLWLLPPWGNRLLSLFKIFAVVGLLFWMHRFLSRLARESTEASAPDGGHAAAVLAILLACSGLMFARPASAQPIPSQDVLNELRERLLAAPDCTPNCVQVSTLAIDARADTLSLDLEVHAEVAGSVAVPGPLTNFAPTSIRLGTQASNAATRLEDGTLRVRVPAGVTHVHLEGPIRGSRVALGLSATAPGRLTFAGVGWELVGRTDPDEVPESIELQRVAEAPVEDARSGIAHDAEQDLQSWITIERTLDMGVEWTMTTRVTRIGGLRAELVALPLLAQEHVTDARVSVVGPSASITLNQGENEYSYTSMVRTSDALQMRAGGETERTTRIWTFQCGPIWHCEFSGITPHVSTTNAVYAPTFHPWPGETLSLQVTRPLGATDGQSVTVDSANLTVSPGIHIATNVLNVSLRSSVSTALELTLPEGANVQELHVNGQPHPFSRVRDGSNQIRISVQPGSTQIVCRFETDDELGIWFRTPDVSIGRSLLNAQVVVTRPTNRWILGLFGAGVGPSLLAWPYLLFCLGLAWLLARRKDIPLGVLDWVLLLVGVLELPFESMVVLVAWFFVVALRGRGATWTPLRFNAMQLWVVFHTLIFAVLVLWAVEHGLSVEPSMGLAQASGARDLLTWYVDRWGATFPIVTVVSLPGWVYRVFMLVWALWLVWRLAFRWVPWAFAAFRNGGFFKRPAPAPTNSASRTENVAQIAETEKSDPEPR